MSDLKTLMTKLKQMTTGKNKKKKKKKMKPAINSKGLLRDVKKRNKKLDQIILGQ